jgi:hypothetical protein
MKNFIKGILTGVDGGLSSKRVIMFAFVATFLIICFVNLFKGKTLSATLSDQLFYLVIYSLAAVFGEQITAIFNKKAPVDVEPPKP